MVLTGAGLVLDERTLVPGQGLLKRLREVEQTPADDHIVVERHKEADLHMKNYYYYRLHKVYSKCIVVMSVR